MSRSDVEPSDGPPWRAAVDAVFERIPQAAALACFVIGLASMISAVTPDMPHAPGLDFLARMVDEVPEFAASVAGITLMALAVGLSRRLDAAWAAACVLLAHAALYCLWRTQDTEAAIAYCVVFATLALSRRAFYRHAGLAALAPSRGWYLAAIAGLAAAAVSAVIWAAHRPGFVETAWWGLVLDPHVGRSGRAFLFAVAALAIVAAWRLGLTPARAAPPPPRIEELSLANAILAGSESVRPESNLVFLGDKSVLVSPDGAAFMMFARSGASLIAMGGPVGKKASWRSALAAFRDEADRLNLRPVVYAAPPDLLPDLIDLGFRVDKIGENALIDLAAFSMSGRRKQNLRTARNRFVEREGAVFDLEAPPHGPERLAELRPVSQAWLAHQKGREKGFSLGAWDEDYLARFPFAVIRLRGKAIAFANIWTTPDRQWVSVDLMRHAPEGAPHGVMDFLFTEIILWAQREGYKTLDLGMAPLSGLAEERHAPAFAHFGRFIFERGSMFYNFRGLREFKEKFDPTWEPRYLAAPGNWSWPVVLAEAALLSSAPPQRRIGRRADKA
jgi:lysylphosphatidylglycerol synthetase-like protein (DUF2156 family)